VDVIRRKNYVRGHMSTAARRQTVSLLLTATAVCRAIMLRRKKYFRFDVLKSDDLGTRVTAFGLRFESGTEVDTD